MDKSHRRAAIAAYKERDVVAGIYAVRCAPTGACWVGRAPDLSKIRNRLWFSLRQGSPLHPAMLAAWREHGEEAFTFEVIERLEKEESVPIRDALLRSRLAHWLTSLGGQPLS